MTATDLFEKSYIEISKKKHDALIMILSNKGKTIDMWIDGFLRIEIAKIKENKRIAAIMAKPVLSYKSMMGDLGTKYSDREILKFLLEKFISLKCEKSGKCLTSSMLLSFLAWVSDIKGPKNACTISKLTTAMKSLGYISKVMRTDNSKHGNSAKFYLDIDLKK